MINPVGRLALNESLPALGEREVNVDQAVREQLGRPLPRRLTRRLLPDMCAQRLQRRARCIERFLERLTTQVHTGLR